MTSNDVDPDVDLFLRQLVTRIESGHRDSIIRLRLLVHGKELTGDLIPASEFVDSVSQERAAESFGITVIDSDENAPQFLHLKQLPADMTSAPSYWRIRLRDINAYALLDMPNP